MTPKEHAETVAKAGREFHKRYDASRRRGYEAKKMLARDIAKKYGINRGYFETLIVSRDSNLW